jgi:hypothetical protein
VPNPIERLCDVDKETPAILFLLKGGGNGVDNTKTLLDITVVSLETTNSNRTWNISQSNGPVVRVKGLGVEIGNFN